MGAVVAIRGLRHERGGRRVLEIDRLEVRAGERLAVLGPNGAGKTSLLRLIAALDLPTAGRVELDGVRTEDVGTELRRGIGYATQRAGLLSTSVVRNVELPLQWRGVGRPERRRAALIALGRLNAIHLSERKAGSLSGGEAQRASLARALALEPALLLLDEPAARLDAEARRAFLDDLENALADRRTTVLHVSHRADEALRLADRVAVLADGTLRQLAGPATLVRQPADATVARLVGYENVVAAEAGADGRVLVGGVPCGAMAAGASGKGTLAAWAVGIRILPTGRDRLTGTVERVSPGPGRWELALDASVPLRAHIPLESSPPSVGDRVGVEIDPARATFIAGRPGRGG